MLNTYKNPMLMPDGDELLPVSKNTKKLIAYLVDKLPKLANNTDRLSKDDLTVKSTVSELYNALNIKEKEGIEHLKGTSISEDLQELLKKEAVINALEKIYLRGLSYYENDTLLTVYVITRIATSNNEIEVTLNGELAKKIRQNDKTLAIVLGDGFNK